MWILASHITAGSLLTHLGKLWRMAQMPSPDSMDFWRENQRMEDPCL